MALSNVRGLVAEALALAHLANDPNILCFTAAGGLALQELRSAYGKPMKITSGYRCPDHEIEKRKPNGPGTHCEPGAIDVAVSGEDAWNLIDIASSHRWGGIGVNTPSFIHLDRRSDPTIWKY
jgi:uncharacterized protein YcbK (DUF882 family)